MSNPLNAVNSFSSTAHAISVSEVGDNAKVRFLHLHPAHSSIVVNFNSGVPWLSLF